MQRKNNLRFTKDSSKTTELFIFRVYYLIPIINLCRIRFFMSKSKPSEADVEKPGGTDLLVWFLSHKKAAMLLILPISQVQRVKPS